MYSTEQLIKRTNSVLRLEEHVLERTNEIRMNISDWREDVNEKSLHLTDKGRASISTHSKQTEYPSSSHL